MAIDRERLRNLPSVDEVLRRPELAQMLERVPRWAVTRAVRLEIEELRQAILTGDEHKLAQCQNDVQREALENKVAELLRPAIVSVINATGVVVHTNLGRSPLPKPALERLVEIAGGYSNLEYELEQGRRGSRHGHLSRLASELCGAEDAVITNNNAAAVLLTISALAAGREVIVSRGELVEIGGGFRIPDVIVQGGARLREVGTTNRTRLSDYEEAIGQDTAALLKVHRSNFDLVGFTQEVEIADLAQLSRARNLPLVADLGSGAMLESYGPGLTGEPVVAQSIAQGADLVCFSGDKLFGGPQAGVILGSATHVAQIRKHPLMRAFRPCKLTLSALEATFELWRDGRKEEIPTCRMLGIDPAEAHRRVQHLRHEILDSKKGWIMEERPVEGRAGGGSMPLRTAPGWALALRREKSGVEAIETALRQGEPPVVARIVDDWLLLDLRTVSKEQEKLLLKRLFEVAEKLELSRCKA